MYRFNYQGGELKQVRQKCIFFTTVSLGLYLFLTIYYTTSGISNGLFSGAELLALIPYIFEIGGLWTLLRAKEFFDETVPKRSVRRMKASGLGILFFQIAALVLHLYLVITAGKPECRMADICFTIELLICILLQILQRKLLLTFHLEKVEEETNSNLQEDKEEQE